MNNPYLEMRDRQQKTVSDYLSKYAFFAFNERQFSAGLEKLKINEADAGERLVSIGGTGGYILKERAAGLAEMIEKYEKELRDAWEDPDTGEDFAYKMLRYELDNHEFCITYDEEETLDALALSWDDVKACANLAHGLRRATREIMERGTM